MTHNPSKLGQTYLVLVCDRSLSVGLRMRAGLQVYTRSGVMMICDTLTVLTSYTISSAS